MSTTVVELEIQMPKQPKQPKGRPRGGGEPTRGQKSYQISFRVEFDEKKNIEEIAKVLGTDATGLIRRMLAKHFHEYQAEAQEIIDKRRSLNLS